MDSAETEQDSRDTLNFINLANRSSGATAERYRLLAFKQFILNGDRDLASELRSQIDLSLLSDTEKNSFLLSDTILLFGTQNRDTLSALESLVPNITDVPEWNYYMGLALSGSGSTQIASEHFNLCSKITPSQIDYRRNCEVHLWEILLESAANRSEGLAAVDSNYRAWTELAALVRNNSGLIENQIKSIESWISVNTRHPARLNLPEQILDLIQLEITAPKSIALVLPLSGRLQSVGEAVLDGFLSAAYLTSAQGYMSPQIEIFDSGALPIELITEIISNDNFDIAVGPLEAENVELFANSVSSELSVLYLNRLSVDEYSSRTHIGFSLAVEGEAQQAAQTAISAGYKSALVLIEDSNIGERAAGAFAEDWVEGDRQIYDLVRLSDATTMTERLERSFHVDQSESRQSQLQTLLGKRLEFTPRRRQDIDTIFLASNSILARQITPTLAFLFAQDVPVLATSRVFDENTDSENNRDLEALNFLAPSWLAKAEQPLEQTISARPLELQKLEAMGVDAFYLSRRFQQLEYPDFRYQGKTGIVYLGNDNNLSRTMEWVRIDGEKMVLAN